MKLISSTIAIRCVANPRIAVIFLINGMVAMDA
jgi:hypothetical protein